MHETTEFYSVLAPLFHLVYPDWEGTIQRQASDLDLLIGEQWGDATKTVRDVACGAGTQALGLAKPGFSVTASSWSAPWPRFGHCMTNASGCDEPMLVGVGIELHAAPQTKF